MDPNARSNIVTECAAILDAIQAAPTDAGFRRQTEKLCTFIKTLAEDPAIATDSDLEAKIGRGQLEEVLVTLRNHKSLVPKMLEWKPWSTGGDELELSFWEVYQEPPKA